MNKLNERLKIALSELEKHCSKYSLLQSYVQNKEPDEIILSAIGSHLHSYYNGIEKISNRFGISWKFLSKKKAGLQSCKLVKWLAIVYFYV